MPIPTVYTPIQPTPSIVMKPVVWTPNVWTAVICNPGPPIIPEVFTVTVTNFTPVVTPSAYFGDPGLTVSLISTNGSSGTAGPGGTGVATATCTFPGTITMTVTGTYTDYLFPNKEYKYRRDVVPPTHLPTPVVSPSGYTAQYGTLNQGSALTRGTFLNPIGGLPIAGTPVVGMIEEIGTTDHMQAYNPDPNFMIIVEYTVVITSSCGIGAGTFPIKQIVYDDKDISSQRFVTAVNSQTGRNPINPKFLP
jgi:hypothetical protein|tara:strand:- start:285 stop:1034 length:750 start_codon:yes stop_codon:yes gene_type:complete